MGAVVVRGAVVMVLDGPQRSISAVLHELTQAARELAGDGVAFELVLVDAGTDRRTIEIATETAAALGLSCEVIASDGTRAWTTQRDGFEYALKRGHPDFLVSLDPAGHHDARQLVELVRSFRARGSGLTIGSRWVRGGAAPGTRAPRNALSRLASFLVAKTTGLRSIRDVTTSFRVIRSDAASLVAATPATIGDYGFYCEFAAAAQAYGFTVDEVPITFRPRFSSVPPLRWGDLWLFAGDLWRIGSRVRAIRAEMRIDQATWAERSGRMREQAPDVGSEFGALEELTELSDARRFTTWIVDEIDDRRAGDIAEVGAGMGAIAAELAARDRERAVVAVEPADNVFASLAARATAHPNLTARQITSGDLARERGPVFDTVVYVNVLEHIRADAAELDTATSLLRPGGRLAVFVPALPALYGSLDYKSGHYRRYTAPQLRSLLEAAGFRDVEVRYIDVLGVFPYWLMYRLVDVDRLDRVSATGYDRVVVPLSRALQRVLPRPPFGKNLLATARR